MKDYAHLFAQIDDVFRTARHSPGLQRQHENAGTTASVLVPISALAMLDAERDVADANITNLEDALCQ